MTTDTLQTLLTRHDPARQLTPPSSTGQVLEDILGGRRTTSTDARLRRPRTRMVRLAAAGVVASSTLTVTVLGGGQQAYAGWTAYPAGLSLGEDSVVTQQCQRWAANSTTQAPTQPVLSERRGDDALALLRGRDGLLIVCHQHLVPGEPVGGSSETRMTEDPSPDGLISDRGSAFANDEGSPIVRTVTGRVGSDVTAVTVHTREQGDVTATVRNGYFAAWWPGESFEPTAGPLPMQFSFTAVLGDGSKRFIGRTAAP